MSFAGCDGFARLSQTLGSVASSTSVPAPSPRVTRQCLKPGPPQVPTSGLTLTRRPCSIGTPTPCWQTISSFRPEVSCSSSQRFQMTSSAATSSLTYTSARHPCHPPLTQPASFTSPLTTSTASWPQILSIGTQWPYFRGAGAGRRMAPLMPCHAADRDETRSLTAALKCRCHYCGRDIYERSYRGHHTSGCRMRAQTPREQEDRILESKHDFQQLLRKAAADDGSATFPGSRHDTADNVAPSISKLRLKARDPIRLPAEVATISVNYSNDSVAASPASEGISRLSQVGGAADPSSALRGKLTSAVLPPRVHNATTPSPVVRLSKSPAGAVTSAPGAASTGGREPPPALQGGHQEGRPDQMGVFGGVSAPAQDNGAWLMNGEQNGVHNGNGSGRWIANGNSSSSSSGDVHGPGVSGKTEGGVPVPQWQPPSGFLGASYQPSPPSQPAPRLPLLSTSAAEVSGTSVAGHQHVYGIETGPGHGPRLLSEGALAPNSKGNDAVGPVLSPHNPVTSSAPDRTAAAAGGRAGAAPAESTSMFASNPSAKTSASMTYGSTAGGESYAALAGTACGTTRAPGPAGSVSRPPGTFGSVPVSKSSQQQLQGLTSSTGALASPRTGSAPAPALAQAQAQAQATGTPTSTAALGTGARDRSWLDAPPAFPPSSHPPSPPPLPRPSYEFTAQVPGADRNTRIAYGSGSNGNGSSDSTPSTDGGNGYVRNAAAASAAGSAAAGTTVAAASRVFLDDGQPAVVQPRPEDENAASPSSAERHLMTFLRDGHLLQAAARKTFRRPRLEPFRCEGFTEDDPYFSSLVPAARDWLIQRRRIPPEVLRRNRVHCTLLPQTGDQPHRLAVAFPFFKAAAAAVGAAGQAGIGVGEGPLESSVVFVKYRLFDPAAPEPFAKKEFRSSLHGEPIMYGLHDIVAGEHTDIIIVEGEMDKMALNAIGLWNVVSVPNGAPSARSTSPSSPPEQVFVRPGEVDQLRPRVRAHYAYLDSFLEALPAPLSRCRFTLATDNDLAGQALRRELLRRLGRERCWEVLSWDNEDELEELSSSSSSGRVGGFRKDANDVLMLDGPEQLVAVLEGAQPAKVSGLATFREYEMEIAAYFQRQDPLQLGVSTGWTCLDPFYRVAPGELTIVTGVPNSGKSEWLDALMVNLAENHGWAFALCSLEKQPLQHVKALIEKRVRKPFRPVVRRSPGGASELLPAMSLEEVVAGFNWLADHFHLIRYEEEDDTGAPSIEWVLAKARTAVMRFGVRGLLIDPYNELDSRRSRDVTETDYIREMLTKVRRFARDTECHVWFVAHPRQQKVLTGQAPGLYDISGSAHWFNKTDNGIVVHRRFEELTDPTTGKRYRNALPEVDIKLQKVRNKDIGTQGEAYLMYDRATGRYEDPARLGQLPELAASSSAASEAASDRVQQRNLQAGYVFRTGTFQQHQQSDSTANVIDVEVAPGSSGSSSSSSSPSVSARGFSPAALPPPPATSFGPQHPPSPPQQQLTVPQHHLPQQLHASPDTWSTLPLPPPPQQSMQQQRVFVPQPISPASDINGASTTPATSPTVASPPLPYTSSAPELAPAPAPRRKVGAATAKSTRKGAPGRKEQQLKSLAAPQWGDARVAMKRPGGIDEMLWRMAEEEEAKQGRPRDNGATGGWQSDGSVYDEDEDEGEGEEGGRVRRAAGHKKRGRRRQALLGEAGVKVMVGDEWVDKAPEVLGSLSSSVAENEGVV